MAEWLVGGFYHTAKLGVRVGSNPASANWGKIYCYFLPHPLRDSTHNVGCEYIPISRYIIRRTMEKRKHFCKGEKLFEPICEECWIEEMDLDSRTDKIVRTNIIRRTNENNKRIKS